jgi:hypothetical protein
MQKLYAAPTLVTKGEIVAATRAGKSGDGDLIVPETGMGAAPGNVGYQL